MTFISKSQVSIDILIYGSKQLFTAVFSDVLDHNSFSYLYTHRIVALQHVLNDFSDTTKCYTNLIVQDFCATAKSFQTLQLCRCQSFPAILDCMYVHACVLSSSSVRTPAVTLVNTLNRCNRLSRQQVLASCCAKSALLKSVRVKWRLDGVFCFMSQFLVHGVFKSS